MENKLKRKSDELDKVILMLMKREHFTGTDEEILTQARTRIFSFFKKRPIEIEPDNPCGACWKFPCGKGTFSECNDIEKWRNKGK